MISISRIRKSFGPQVVLDGIDLEIENGSMVAVVGPSGTGKSVLIKIITGLLSADGGEVRIDSQIMTGATSEKEREKIRSRMGILFQSAALFDSLNLLENVAFPLRFRGKMSEKEIISRSIGRLEEVGLRGHETALPGEVSIGMRKRVGIARALVTEPEVLLFDEPNTGLDPEMGQEIYELIQETHERFKFTGLVISHEIPEVFQICKRVVMLYGGKVQCDSNINGFLASENPVVKQFIKGEIEGPIQMV